MHWSTQAGLRATVALLLQPPKCWGNRHETACIVLSVGILNSSTCFVG